MKLLFALFLLISSVFSWSTQPTINSTFAPETTNTAQPVAGDTDRECGNDLSNLWLDVVVVVDNSVGMTKMGLTKIAAQVATLFGQETRIGTQYSDPRTTRVGIVTYSSSATINANLDTYQSADDLLNNIFNILSQTSQATDAYTSKGIGAAEQVLTDGRRNGIRSNYKQLVLIYASNYKSDGNNDPKPIAARLKASGVNIVTVAFNQDGDESLIAQLGELATVGYSFSSQDMNTVGEIQGALIQTNCFCPSLWQQYRSDFLNENSYKYGVCLITSGLQAGWTPAKFACQNMIRNGYLATEFDRQKHDFLFQLVQNDTTVQQPYMYHIGLSFVNGGYYWAQPAGQPLKPLNSNQFWNPGYPIRSSTTLSVLNSQVGSGLTVGWQNINGFGVSKDYICETISCDTDNYCP